MKRGEIRWAEHPDWPRRPALVLTRNEAIDRLSEVFVVLATTTMRGLPTEVEHLNHQIRARIERLHRRARKRR